MDADGLTKCLRTLVLLLAWSAAPVLAGPPFQTDDPEPVDFQHFEAYFFSSYDTTGIGQFNLGPAFEMNWGAVKDVQIHLVVPAATFCPSMGPAAFGIGDTEVGIKYRFIHETKHRPEVGIFPFVELPSGSARAGLGNGSTWYRLPLWVQKSGGPWTTYGGGGVVVNHQPGMRNYPFAGWLVQRDLGKKLTLGTEVFYHSAEGALALSTRPTTMVDGGGYYYIRKPGFQVLFMAGHSVAGQSETVAYLGLYWTWGGGKSSKPDAFLRDHVRGRG